MSDDFTFNGGSDGGGSTPDADATTKGKVQLAGDLAGTAAAPTVPGLTTEAAARVAALYAAIGTSVAMGAV